MSKSKKSVAPIVAHKPFTDADGNSTFPVKALGGVVFILPDPKWTAEKLGGIILPETVKSRKNTGTVMSCGKGCKNTRTKKFEHGNLPFGTRVHFEDSVPWNYEVADLADLKVYNLVMCNIVDVVGIEE